MQQYPDYLTELEEASKWVHRGNSALEPLRRLAWQKYSILRLREVRLSDATFRSQLNDAIREADPEKAMYKLCELYSEAMPEQRKEISKRFPFNRKWQLPNQAKLACDLPEEPPSEQRIRTALISTAMKKSADYRDFIYWLGPIYHSALLIGLDADALFKEISDIATPVAASAIHSFISRDASLRTLSACALRQVVTEHGTELREVG